MARPKGTSKYVKNFNLRLTKDEYLALSSKSLDWGCTRSELIRAIINQLDNVSYDGRNLSNLLTPHKVETKRSEAR